MYNFLLLLDHESRCSLNRSMQSAICGHGTKMDNSVMVFGVSKYSKLNNRSLVEDDKLGRAVLMKKLDQASFCGVDNCQEDRLSRKMIFKAQAKLQCLMLMWIKWQVQHSVGRANVHISVYPLQSMSLTILIEMT
jgi:hypothetical protein